MMKMIPVPIPLLSQVPQPLHSIVESYWQAWSVACEESAIKFQSELPLELLGKVWACSDFVARNCIRYPQIFDALCQEGFQLPRSLNDYRRLVAQAIESTSGDAQIMKTLREL